MTNNMIERVIGITNNMPNSGISKKLQLQLLNVLDGAINTGKNAIEFAYEQTPLLVQEIIRYNMIINGLWCLSSVISLFICYKFSKWIWNSMDEGVELGDFAAPLFMFGCVLPAIGSVIVFAFHIGNFLQTIFAPRLFLLEYAANLVK